MIVLLALLSTTTTIQWKIDLLPLEYCCGILTIHQTPDYPSETYAQYQLWEPGQSNTEEAHG